MRVFFAYMFCGTLLVLLAFAPAFGQDTNFSPGPQYLANTGSPSFARSISTPSMSLAGPPLEVGASDATGGLVAGSANQAVSPPQAVALPKIDLFPIYYGRPSVGAVEINLSEPSGEVSPATPLPASILETGVSQVSTADALGEGGYGVNLAEAAAQGKGLIRHAARFYTNTDIDRLHGGE